MIAYQDIQSSIQVFLHKHPNGVIILRGATATGKTSLSLQLAQTLPPLGQGEFRQSRKRVSPGGKGGEGGFVPKLEFISADSRQIYRHMNIGTDKVSEDIRSQIPHHMIDIVDPSETYTAGQRKAAVEKIIPEIQARGNIPLIVGGTGLYIDMIYKNFSMPEVAPDMSWRADMMKKEEENPGYLFHQLQQVDPEEALKHHPNSTRYILRALEIYTKTGHTKTELAKELPVKRPLLMIGLRREKEETNKLINARIKEMLAGGLIEEIKGLLEKGYTLEYTAMNGIGYKEIVGYLQGEYNLDKAEELLKRNTHRYAKRQRSWFRRYIAEGKQYPKEHVEYLVIEL